MKIVFVIDQVYLHGGIERVLSVKANYLSSIENNTVYIVTTEQNKKKPCYELNSNIIFNDLNINYYRNKSYFHPKNLFKIPNHIRRVQSLFKKVKPDIIIVCNHSVDTFFLPFVNRKIPKIKEFHFSKFTEEEKRTIASSKFKNWFFKFADYVEKKYDALVVLNPDEANYFKSNNTVIIPNPLTFFSKKVSSLSNKIVITAGRIAPVKGYDVLIDIWAIVVKSVSDWKLHIYGEGNPDYVKMLESKINELGLQNSLILKKSTNDIEKVLINSSIFVMTSHNECFPLVLLEAQVCGLPIVSFNCPNGPRNIINKNSGELVPINDIEAFAKTLINLTKNENLLIEMGKNARNDANKYNIDKIMESWINLFKSLVKKDG